MNKFKHRLKQLLEQCFIQVTKTDGAQHFIDAHILEGHFQTHRPVNKVNHFRPADKMVQI